MLVLMCGWCGEDSVDDVGHDVGVDGLYYGSSQDRGILPVWIEITWREIKSGFS